MNMRITDVRIYGLIQKETPQDLTDETLEPIFEAFERNCRESGILPKDFDIVGDTDVIYEHDDEVLISILFQ